MLSLLPSKWVSGPPLVWTIQLGRRQTLMTGLVGSIAALGAARIMTVSEAAVRQSVPGLVLQLTKGRVIVNYGGIDVDRYRKFGEEEHPEVRKRWGIPVESVLITMVASLTFRKGLDVMVAAIRRLHQEGLPIHRAVAGTAEDGASTEFVDSLRRSVDDERLPVTLLVWVEDVPELMGVTDVFVLPSRGECLPRAILEAMASSVPPIVTIAGGSEETVIEGESGLQVMPGAVDRLAVRIREPTHDLELRRRMGEAARRRCETMFSEARFQDTFVRLFDDLQSSQETEAVMPASER